MIMMMNLLPQPKRQRQQQHNNYNNNKQSDLIRFLHICILIALLLLISLLAVSNLKLLFYSVQQQQDDVLSNNELRFQQQLQYRNLTQQIVYVTNCTNTDSSNNTVLYHPSDQRRNDENSNTDTNNSTILTSIEIAEGKCYKEYMDVKVNQTTPGFQYDDYERSRAYYGNRQRLYHFVQGLQQHKPTRKPKKIIICGGSITIGHGVQPKSDRYADRFVSWLNQQYPIQQSDTTTNNNNNQQQQQHEVFMKVAHGADMCAMAKRIHRIDIPDDPDLFVLEFAVNDYQGQDHIVHVDHKTDLFYNGFERLAICAEAVVHTLLLKYPKAAIVFLEFRTAILNRKTAQLLHNGVAQHYQIPVISYADAIFPKYYNLISKLNRSTAYSVPIGESIQPFPFGCLDRCRTEKMTEDFGPEGCKSVCLYLKDTGYSDLKCDPQRLPAGRMPCYPSFLAHDSVHPSSMGHQLATDLLIELIAVTTRELCRFKYTAQVEGDTNVISIADTNFALPRVFGFYAAPELLSMYSDFVLVKDTMYTFGKQDELNAVTYSTGFTLYGDGFAERKGWICTSPNGGEYIEFAINLPIHDCYVIYLAGLKSYVNMGVYTIEMTDTNTNKVTRLEVDGQWAPRISIPSDIPVNTDVADGSCTGQCTIKITTHPQLANRTGNKVKIMSLSARKCIPQPPAPEVFEDNIPPVLSKAYDLDNPSSWITV